MCLLYVKGEGRRQGGGQGEGRITWRNVADIVSGEMLYPTPNSWFYSQIKLWSAVCDRHSVEQRDRGASQTEFYFFLQQSTSIDTWLLWDLITCLCLDSCFFFSTCLLSYVCWLLPFNSVSEQLSSFLHCFMRLLECKYNLNAVTWEESAKCGAVISAILSRMFLLCKFLCSWVITPTLPVNTVSTESKLSNTKHNFNLWLFMKHSCCI